MMATVACGTIVGYSIIPEAPKCLYKTLVKIYSFLTDNEQESLPHPAYQTTPKVTCTKTFQLHVGHFKPPP
jgi:hypothetical protein